MISWMCAMVPALVESDEDEEECNEPELISLIILSI